MRNATVLGRAALAVALLAPAACSDFLDVTNPGPIADDALNGREAMPGLVVGMAADLSAAVSQVSIWSVLWGDDLRHSGTLGAPTIFTQGIIAPEDVGPVWNDMHRARWVAEDGIERMQDVLGSDYSTSELAAEANVYAGYANRILGENVCDAVFDGGPAEPYTVHFTRAEEYFTQAVTLAQAAGSTTLQRAALAGRAQVRAALGDWTGAATDAAVLPVDFRFDAIFSENTGREENGWYGVTISRGEYTVWGSEWHSNPDPRAPWEAALTSSGDTAVAANGYTLWLKQQKFTSNADDIPLAKGTEMLLIRAEAALRAGDVTGAMAFINEGRAAQDMETVTATTAAEAWTILHRERGADMWLEGRRFWDTRRWFEETGDAHLDWLNGRDKCVPVSREEVLSNPNF
jgi:hypothetical protein